jgi:hypothetical protein
MLQVTMSQQLEPKSLHSLTFFKYLQKYRFIKQGYLAMTKKRSWNEVDLEKLQVHLFKIFSTFYRTRMFFTVLTRARHLPLTGAK